MWRRLRRIAGFIGEVIVWTVLELGGPLVWLATMMGLLVVGTVAIVRRLAGRALGRA